MTGLSRWSIGILGLISGAVAVLSAVALVGAAGLCGFSENQTPTGYCVASATTRFFLVAIPAGTVIIGYGLSLKTGRLTPAAVAGTCAIAEGLIALAFGY